MDEKSRKSPFFKWLPTKIGAGATVLKSQRLTLPRLSMLMLFASGTAQAGLYSVNDLINHFNLIESEAHEFIVKDCNQIPWLQKALCQEIKDNVTSRLAAISPYIGDGELIKRDTWNGEKKYGRKTYVTKTDLSLRIDGSSSISFNNQGLAIDDLFYPYIARLYVLAGASGDGDGYVKNIVCHDPPLCLVKSTHKDNFDIDFFGKVELDIIAGFAANAKVIETQDEYILILQPFFRLIARDSTADIDYDVNGLSPFTPIFNLVDIGHSAFDMSIDLALFDFDSAIEDFIAINESGLISLVSATVIADDISNDSFTRITSEILTYFADEALDRETHRVLYEQEKAVNEAIKTRLGLDANGLVAYHFSKPQIHGRTVAELIPAIML